MHSFSSIFLLFFHASIDFYNRSSKCFGLSAFLSASDNAIDFVHCTKDVSSSHRLNRFSFFRRCLFPVLRLINIEANNLKYDFIAGNKGKLVWTARNKKDVNFKWVDENSFCNANLKPLFVQLFCIVTSRNQFQWKSISFYSTCIYSFAVKELNQIVGVWRFFFESKWN